MLSPMIIAVVWKVEHLIDDAVRNIGSHETTGSQPKRALDRADEWIGIGDFEVHVELPADCILRHAVVIVRARHHHIVAVLQTWSNSQPFPFLRNLVAEFRQGIGGEIKERNEVFRDLSGRTSGRRKRHAADINRAGNIDTEELLVGRREFRAYADTSVVAFEDEELMIVDCEQG